MNGAEIDLVHVSRHFAQDSEQTLTALDDVSISITAGSAVAVMGPSGSGKSTLLHIIGAMDQASSGTVRVGDTVVSDMSERARAEYRRSVGFVFQRFHLLPALTVLD
ncbi:MAG: ATP-binding cassette domain-containing protein, partial [Actinomycetota bacterium]